MVVVVEAFVQDMTCEMEEARKFVKHLVLSRHLFVYKLKKCQVCSAQLVGTLE